MLRTRWAGLLAGLAGVAIVTGLIELASGQVNVLSMAVCYQLLVLVVSGAFGAPAGLWTGGASVVAFNWFFIPPTQTLDVGDSRNWISLGVFAATALVTSHLAAGYRRERRESEARRRDSDLLAELAQTVLRGIGPGEPAPEVARAAARALGVTRCSLVLGARERALEVGETSRLRPSPHGFTVPLLAAGQPLGLLEVGPALPDGGARWARPGFALAVGGLAAAAVERGRLIQAGLDAEGLRRSDEMKTALLHGVSHEFRTPLTAIRTAAHALREGPGGSDAGPLLAVMGEETERLERLVANLLDLSRLEAGALVLRLDWCAPAEMAAGALDAADALLAGRPVDLDVPDGLPLVRADAVLCERILVNLLHNAVRHGAPPIRVAGRVAGDFLALEVADAGVGPDAALAGRIFAPFVSGAGTGGTGVGLALARGLAEAQGGALRLERGGAGTRFVLSLPLSPVPELAT